MLKYLLAHPLTRDIPLDDPRIVPLRARIVKEKRFLTRIYADWYRLIRQHIPDGTAPVVELGTGPGFFKEVYPQLITSELIPGTATDLMLDGQDLPFEAGSLRALVMVDVLHHMQAPRLFFTSAARSVRVGGGIIMIEPWNTPWSRWVYTHLHHEPFDPTVEEWELDGKKPLSAANGALPWILFFRDKQMFSKECPDWKVERIQPIMPLVYLLSGGFSTRLSPPSWSYPFFRFIEQVLSPFAADTGLFALIHLSRTGKPVF